MENKSKTLHELFDVSILLKEIHALLEIIGGILTFFISPDFILKFVTKITQGELLEDPNDYLTRHLINFAQSISIRTTQFIAYYLLFHGIINLILAVGLSEKKIWAYHTSFIVITIFALYQAYRYFYHPSIWMVILTIFDLITIWLIYKEYKRIQYI